MTRKNGVSAITELHTPAFVYDENSILNNLSILSKFRESFGCKILFPLKTFSIADALDVMTPAVNGFSVSSLFEAKLVREFLGYRGIVHITTPGFRPDEIEDISKLCDYISFNSLSQLKRFYHRAATQAKCGIRINPQLSFVEDCRYNPCRKHSKLGVPLDQLCAAWQSKSWFVKKINGILFHTNCESKDINQLLQTVKHIDKTLPELFAKLSWINLGGGYLFNNQDDLAPLAEAVNFIKNKYDVDIFFEPGKAIVGEAGSIVSTVLDIFSSDGKDIAVLDTTVNHMPEIFEYQIRPEVMQESIDGKYEYILAGTTCLAGDLFGEYQFSRPLKTGSRIIFQKVGAYTLVKASMFNGVNLPMIYARTQDGKFELKKQFDYEHFLSKCGGGTYATV
ncbi:MAG: carboxynorspermidine decarboxylase [Omnitrophica bacterium]|nr:carboxynorspermidine decarboxylase [Candidatus Omnitrophota bacterium]